MSRIPAAARDLLLAHRGPAAARASVEVVADTANFVARVQVGNEAYALRAPRVPDSVTRVDRASELTILETAAAAGIAPPVVASDARTGALLTRWIANRPWTLERAAQDDALALVADLFRKVHALAVPTRARRIDLRLLIEEYAAQIERGRATVPGWRGSLRAGAEAVRVLQPTMLRRLRELPTLGRSLCHNDVHHRNVIEADRRLWLLDWEYAGEGERLFDFASFATQNELNERQSARFLEVCGVAGEAAERFGEWCLVFDYVALAWLVATTPAAPSEFAEPPALARLLERLDA